MTPDQHIKAKTVCAWIAKAENPDAEDYPIDQIRAERWTEVCEAVQAHPDLSAATIAERLRGAMQESGPKLEFGRPECKSPTSALETVTAEARLPTAAEREVARRRLADIRDRLAQGKAPMGEQPEREES